MRLVHLTATKRLPSVVEVPDPNDVDYDGDLLPFAQSVYTCAGCASELVLREIESHTVERCIQRQSQNREYYHTWGGEANIWDEMERNKQTDWGEPPF